MGIYDRDYYRKEGPTYIGSLFQSGRMCKWLVGINVAMWFLQLAAQVFVPEPPVVPGLFPEEELLLRQMQPRAQDPITYWLSMQPRLAFEHLQLWRIVTGMFLHSPNDPWHLIFNMLMLWFFGKWVEDIYGPKEFLAFYLAAGICGNLCWGLAAYLQRGADPGAFALGASGAVMGVMVLCALHFPNRPVLLMWLFPIPLWLLACLYVGADLFYFLRGANLGVAVAAHLGGAAFGLLYNKMQWRILGGWKSFLWRMRRPLQSRPRIHREDPPATIPFPTQRRLPADEMLEAKADAVLEKLNQKGKDALTPDEWDILQQASERYRKKRT
jgi:membrane associated rhomboid family serine protease